MNVKNYHLLTKIASESTKYIDCKSILSVFLISTCGLASFPAYASPIQFGANFYDFVSAENITWQDAKNAAASSTFMGLNGYLATITSAAENSFLMGQFAGFSGFAGSWLGGEVNAFGTGKWRAGPESSQTFSQGNVSASGAYANWGGVEPNSVLSAAYMNVGTTEHLVNTGQWADAANGVASAGDPIKGYFVEYSAAVVHASPVNLALTGTATQSSTWDGTWSTADRALDGDTDGNYGHKSVSHSLYGMEWWQVSLDNTYSLDRIEIWNRTDAASERLSNFYVEVLNSLDDVIWRQDYFTTGGYPSPNLTIDLPSNIAGDTVKIGLNSPNYLHLAEVLVVGTSLPSSSVPEPTSMLLLSIGIAGLTGSRIGRKQQRG